MPTRSSFEIEGYFYENTVACLLGIHDGPFHTSLKLGQERHGGFLLPRLLVITYDHGGNPICIALTGEDRGSVYLWDFGLKIEADGSPGEADLYPMASSFTGFGEMLSE